MTRALRWRIVVFQVVAILVLVAGALFANWAYNFDHSYVRDQLVQQKIFFPPKGSAALSPKEFPDLQKYAGQQVDNGDKAKAYAQGFINRHLRIIGGGKTYAQVSAAALKNPKSTKLQAQALTLFRGETLRFMLLNVWGWWQMGTYALYALFVLVAAAAVVFLALLFELFVAFRRSRPTDLAARGNKALAA